MLDARIAGGTVVDGTGRPAYRGDIGVSAGRIVVLDRGSSELARRTIDAAGLVVAPGFIDPHTHYDAQLFWDPLASPSCLHGTTTVIGGNCGFTLAPLQDRDADFVRRLLARVEGIPLAALESGIDWEWASFADYLDRLEGRIGLNAGFFVGHSTLRRHVLGTASGGPASADQIEAMAALLDESISAGGLGLSTSMASTHTDGEGKPVPSRSASADELLALSAVVGLHPGTSLEGIFQGAINGYTPEEMDLLAQMSRSAGGPLNWNLLRVNGDDRERVAHQLSASDRARVLGGDVVALTMPIFVPMTMSFSTYCTLFNLPGWAAVMGLPVDQRAVQLRDPAVRRHLLERAHSPEAGELRRLAEFDRYRIGDTYAPANAGATGRLVADIAAERGQEPFDALLDIVLADDLRTVLWPMSFDDSAEAWDFRRRVWEDDRVMLGGSDAGAHVDRMAGAGYATRFLADAVRTRGLLSLERAVQLLTERPAKHFGLKGRGRIADGYAADLVLFDPTVVDADEPRMQFDFPGSSGHFHVGARGVERVMVNGTEIVAANEVMGALPGKVLRSGRDTELPSRH